MNDLYILRLAVTPLDMYNVGYDKMFSNLERFIDFLEEIYHDFYVVSMKKYYVKGRGLLSMLTAQQYKCLRLAVENGFYDIPKKADTRKLAKAVGLAHGTYSFHVRKAERSIFKTFFE